MNILGLDPAPTESAIVLFEPGKPGRVLDHMRMRNSATREYLTSAALDEPPPLLVIEDMQSYGKPVGREVFETVRWTGRFDAVYGTHFRYITRKEVMLHLCGSARGNDATVRQALIDRWGGSAAIKGAQKCKTCKGRGVIGRRKEVCPVGIKPTKVIGDPCYASLAGPLHGISGDQWSALAIAVAYSELHPEVTR